MLVYPFFRKVAYVQQWPTIYVVVASGIHVGYIIGGVLLLVESDFPFFLWTMPWCLHVLWVPFVAAEAWFGRRGFPLSRIYWAVRACWWMAFNLPALILPIVGYIYRWKSLVLVQCLLCVAVCFERESWQWLRKRLLRRLRQDYSVAQPLV